MRFAQLAVPFASSTPLIRWMRVLGVSGPDGTVLNLRHSGDRDVGSEDGDAEPGALDDGVP